MAVAMAMANPTRHRTGVSLVVRSEGVLGFDALAREAQLAPALVKRLISLGLVEPSGGTRASPLFRRSDAGLLMRATRLRSDLGLNYAGAVLASELLERIDRLEWLLAQASFRNEMR
jgi:chaperone modulatory protein CbpM